jgi:hypothetical protein
LGRRHEEWPTVSYEGVLVPKTRTFALVYGVAFLLVGLLGFVPALLAHPSADGGHAGHAGPDLTVTAFEGYLFGLFHVNVLHSLVHVLFGVMGLAMSRSYGSARLYARVVTVAYAVLAVMGLIPGLNMVFGLIPIHGHDVWLHVLLAAPAAYFGFAGPRWDATVTTPTATV